MKKFPIVYSLGVVFCFALAYFSADVSKVGIVAIPFLLYVWIRRRNADMWLEEMSPQDRIIFLALENKEMLPFVGRKVNEEYAKIGDKYVKTHKNTAYVYAKKILMFASQRKVDPNTIYELKRELGESLFSIKLFRKKGFWKCMGIPIVALFSFLLPMSSAIKWAFLLSSPFVSLLYVWMSGALEFASTQGMRELTSFYFSGARKMEPLVCPLMSGGYADMPGHGVLRLADNTDYFLGRSKIFLSSRGVNHTFSLEMAKKATWFKNIGLRDKYDLRTAIYLVEEGAYNSYGSVEDAYKQEGMKFINAARELAEKKKKEISLRPRLIRITAPRKRAIKKPVGGIPDVS